MLDTLQLINYSALQSKSQLSIPKISKKKREKEEKRRNLLLNASKHPTLTTSKIYTNIQAFRIFWQSVLHIEGKLKFRLFQIPMRWDMRLRFSKVFKALNWANMFKSARWKKEKTKIKAVFKLQFQATQVFSIFLLLNPNGIILYSFKNC